MGRLLVVLAIMANALNTIMLAALGADDRNIHKRARGK